MKTLIHKLLLIAFLLAGMMVQAQPNQNKKEQLEALKVATFTKTLNLTSQEAATFWPIYNEYDSELDALRKKHKEDKGKLDNAANLSDAEIEKLVDGEIIFRQQELDIIKKYHAQFKKILPMKKVALIYKAQDEYKKALLGQLKEKGK